MALGRADVLGFEPVAAVRAVPASLMMAAKREWSLARLALQSEPVRSAEDVDERLLRGLADSILKMQELQPPEQSVSLRVSSRVSFRCSPLTTGLRALEDCRREDRMRPR